MEWKVDHASTRQTAKIFIRHFSKDFLTLYCLLRRRDWKHAKISRVTRPLQTVTRYSIRVTLEIFACFQSLLHSSIIYGNTFLLMVFHQDL